MWISWSHPIGLWSVGLTAWDLLGPRRLFTAGDEDGNTYDAAHLAELIAALGPPPLELLRRNREIAADFRDEKGNWLGLALIPANRWLEELETRLKDSTRFIAFLRSLDVGP
ncbi:hypothetical protein ACJ41O_003493 [Fusarium nematophilum]